MFCHAMSCSVGSCKSSPLWMFRSAGLGRVPKIARLELARGVPIWSLSVCILRATFPPFRLSVSFRSQAGRSAGPAGRCAGRRARTCEGPWAARGASLLGIFVGAPRVRYSTFLSASAHPGMRLRCGARGRRFRRAYPPVQYGRRLSGAVWLPRMRSSFQSQVAHVVDEPSGGASVGAYFVRRAGARRDRVRGRPCWRRTKRRGAARGCGCRPLAMPGRWLECALQRHTGSCRRLWSSTRRTGPGACSVICFGPGAWRGWRGSGTWPFRGVCWRVSRLRFLSRRWRSMRTSRRSPRPAGAGPRGGYSLCACMRRDPAETGPLHQPGERDLRMMKLRQKISGGPEAAQTTSPYCAQSSSMHPASHRRNPIRLKLPLQRPYDQHPGQLRVMVLSCGCHGPPRRAPFRPPRRSSAVRCSGTAAFRSRYRRGSRA